MRGSKPKPISYQFPAHLKHLRLERITNKRIHQVLTDVSQARLSKTGGGQDNVIAHYNFCCPSHDDRNPSAFLTAFKDGGFCIGCFAGCDEDAMLEALELTKGDLRPVKVSAEPTAYYDYRDEDERLLYQVCRYKTERGKQFRQRRMKDGKWQWNLGKVRRVLYRLPELVEGLNSGQTIHITEGEKDADRLASLGFYSTTCAMGAGKWSPEYSRLLAMADVVLYADNDPAGETHVLAVAGQLHEQMAAVRIVRFLDAGPKGDVSDWLDQGHTVEELHDRIGEAEIWHPSREFVIDLPEGATHPYGEDEYGLYLKGKIRDGEINKIRLANFTARIIHDISQDNGAERIRLFEVTVQMNDRECTVAVPASEFSSMHWVTEMVGTGAVVHTGSHYRDHVRCAIQLLSSPVTEKMQFAHTGWRQINNKWHYLHSAGSITEHGSSTGVEVHLEGSLSPFRRPDPPSTDEARNVVLATLGLLRVAPYEVMGPLLGAVYRAPLGLCDSSIHLTGASGVFKSELAALAMQHCGEGFDARHLPAAWSGTANSIEALAFQMKDAPLVIDDFCPRGTLYDRGKLQNTADRILRAQGNAAGRTRMRSDTTLRSPKPPRGIIISTGEDSFDGRSLNARVLTVELTPGMVQIDKLTVAQQQGRQGVFATAFSGYIQWLAAQKDDIEKNGLSERRSIRQKFESMKAHARTPDILANIMWGWTMFLRYARHVEALSEKQEKTCLKKLAHAVASLNEMQVNYQRESDPARQFIVQLMAAIRSQQAHVADKSGGAPMDEESMWGWKQRKLGGEHGGVDWQGSGPRVGFLTNDDYLYVDEDAAYKAVQLMARSSNQEIPLSKHALRKRLNEAGYLVGEERGRGKYLNARLTIQGHRMTLLRIPLNRLSDDERDADRDVIQRPLPEGEESF